MGQIMPLMPTLRPRKVRAIIRVLKLGTMAKRGANTNAIADNAITPTFLPNPFIISQKNII